MIFKEIALEDLVEEYIDNRGRSCPTTVKDNEFLPLIATNCITDRLYPEFLKVRSVDKETYDTWFRGHPLPGDILFVNKGTPGKVALVPNPVNFCIAQDMVALRIKKQYYTKYIFAVLRSKQIQEKIENMHVGTLIPHFKKGDFKTLKLPIADSYSTQKKIGDFYFNISEKIETNYRIIEIIESINNTLFKRWFIDFEFPNEEGQPFKSSSGKMVESELGEIPDGWKVGNLKEIALIIMGQSPKGDTYNTDGIGTPLINGASDFKGGDINPNKYTTDPKKVSESGDFIFGVRATLGNVTETDTQYAIGRGAGIARAIKEEYKEFLYSQLVNAFNNFEHTASGSVYQNISRNDLNDYKIVIPHFNVMENYHTITESILKMKMLFIQENKKLSSLRDLLLPKLLSGEIKIPDESVVS